MKSNNKIVVAFVFALCLAGIVRVWKPTAAPVAVSSPTRMLMGTVARVIAVGDDAAACEAGIDAAFLTLESVEKSMSWRISDSQLAKVNAGAFDQPVRISGELFEVLEKSIEFSEISGGAFDVTVGPMIDLWKSAAKSGTVPTAAQLEDAKKRTGYKKLILDKENLTVRFAAAGMRIDLGAIAKGFAIDQAAEALRSAGVLGGMVDVGGDIRCFGQTPPGRNAWMIALQDPAHADMSDSKLLMMLRLKDQAVATSGDYRRFETVDGKKQSHIIDPKTESGAKKFSSVTIIAPDAATADALATMTSVMGKEKAVPILDKLTGVHYILISPAPDYQTTKSAGIDDMIEE